MGNYFSRQSDGLAPTPSGRAKPRDAAYKEDIVIDDMPDKTVWKVEN